LKQLNLPHDLNLNSDLQLIQQQIQDCFQPQAIEQAL
jgi:hypothetical protein